MKKYNLLLIALLPLLNSFSQRPCSTPEYRQFDFWLGEWDAYNPQGKKSGDSKISLQLDSCTILEEWTSTGVQRGLRFAGKSYNMFNAATKKWQQYFVDNTGTITKYFNGHYEPGKMILQTDNNKVNDTLWQIQKMTFYDLGPDKVRQHGETSRDNGKTWTTSFDLEYRRKANNISASIDSILRSMEDGYNKGDYRKIADHYSVYGKVVGKNVEVSGRDKMLNYWKSIVSMGGTWKLSNEKAEMIGNMVWQRGTSVITTKDGKQHKVDFTLIFIREDGLWKIIQDTYW